MLPQKSPLVTFQAGQGKHISVRPNANPPNASFIFIYNFFLHDLSNVFCFVKIELQNPKKKAAI